MLVSHQAGMGGSAGKHSSSGGSGKFFSRKWGALLVSCVRVGAGELSCWVGGAGGFQF